ncbi:GNAT family N-acetyltransferase [Streptomyces sp. NPDC005775]|uniref:GNAT family N-acetyltransferase n=1 Tax=Streptomyces sp. NPDC005775 TaxID=3364729 RepID=UPI00368AA813
MALDFRRADTADTAAAQDAYRRIIKHLAETVDFPHWHTENHPTPEEVRDWIGAGELYLATTDEGITGVVVLNHEAPDAYQTAEWSVNATDDEVLVVHALGVVPDHLGQGVARHLVHSAVEEARARGCRTLRLDTYVENIPARELYRRYGFTDLGEHVLHYEGTDLDRFHLFELAI